MNKKSVYVFWVCIVAIAWLTLPLAAQQAARGDLLKVSLTAQLVVTTVDEKGGVHETIQALPDRVQPGNIIEYTITAFNTSTGCPCVDTLTNVAILGAVPGGTVYMENSATKDYAPTFSIDGGSSYSPWPVSYTVRQPDGTEIKKTAGPEMCTGIRWTLASVEPQAKFILRYRVSVSK